MLRIWGQPLAATDLQRLATPQAGDLESFPDIRYDRQTFPQAGGVANLSFFTNVSAPNVSNMELAGQFPAPQALASGRFSQRAIIVYWTQAKP